MFTARLLLNKGIISSTEEVNKVLRNGTTAIQDQLLELKASDEELTKRRELQAEVFNLESKFFNENRRNISQIAALQEELRKAEEDRINRRIAAQRDLDKVVLESTIRVNEDILKDERSTLEQREKALHENVDARIGILAIEDRKSVV